MGKAKRQGRVTAEDAQPVVTSVVEAEGAVEDFRSPEGMVSVTIDVTGARITTCSLDPDALGDLMAAISLHAAQIPFRMFVARIAAHYFRSDAADDHVGMSLIGPSAMWTVLCHPDDVEGKLRKAVGEELNKTGRAHLTWRFDPEDGLAFALADRYVDLSEEAAKQPPGRVTIVGMGEASTVTRH